MSADGIVGRLRARLGGGLGLWDKLKLETHSDIGAVRDRAVVKACKRIEARLHKIGLYGIDRRIGLTSAVKAAHRQLHLDNANVQGALDAIAFRNRGEHYLWWDKDGNLVKPTWFDGADADEEAPPATREEARTAVSSLEALDLEIDWAVDPQRTMVDAERKRMKADKRAADAERKRIEADERGAAERAQREKLDRERAYAEYREKERREKEAAAEQLQERRRQEAADIEAAERARQEEKKAYLQRAIADSGKWIAEGKGKKEADAARKREEDGLATEAAEKAAREKTDKEEEIATCGAEKEAETARQHEEKWLIGEQGEKAAREETAKRERIAVWRSEKEAAAAMRMKEKRLAAEVAEKSEREKAAERARVAARAAEKEAEDARELEEKRLACEQAQNAAREEAAGQERIAAERAEDERDAAKQRRERQLAAEQEEKAAQRIAARRREEKRDLQELIEQTLVAAGIQAAKEAKATIEQERLVTTSTAKRSMGPFSHSMRRSGVESNVSLGLGPQAFVASSGRPTGTERSKTTSKVAPALRRRGRPEERPKRKSSAMFYPFVVSVCLVLAAGIALWYPSFLHIVGVATETPVKDAYEVQSVAAQRNESIPVLVPRQTVAGKGDGGHAPGAKSDRAALEYVVLVGTSKESLKEARGIAQSTRVPSDCHPPNRHLRSCVKPVANVGYAVLLEGILDQFQAETVKACLIRHKTDARVVGLNRYTFRGCL